MVPSCPATLAVQSPPRTRTAPEIKWLLNELAALRGQVQSQSERASAIQAEAEKVERRALRLRKAQARAAQQAQAAATAILALELVLEQVAHRVNAAAAGVVHSWVGKYGRRGALTAFLRTQLTTAVEPLTVSELVDSVATHFDVDVSASILRKKLHQSVKRRVLELFHEEGVLERVVVERPGKPDICWRWRLATTLDSLRAQAEQIERPTDGSNTHPV